jgi:hypothetical protein
MLEEKGFRLQINNVGGGDVRVQGCRLRVYGL